MKKVMRKLSVLALVCCMVLGLGIGVRVCRIFPCGIDEPGTGSDSNCQ